MSGLATGVGAGARIGPNAIVQVLAAVSAVHGAEEAAALLQAAELSEYLARPPRTMVAEVEVVRLFETLAERVDACLLAADAGHRTGEYLLANRIPKPAQVLLKRLPASLAARALLKAIGGHAWTFAGSGQFQAHAGHPVCVSIVDGPIGQAPAADPVLAAYYAATFARLFGILVHPATEIRDLSHDDGECQFQLVWK